MTAPHLPEGVDAEYLRRVVAESRSWRAVLRAFGLTSTHRGRQMRAWCDANGVSHAHFSQRSYDEATLVRAVAGAVSWDDLVRRLGLSTTSGSAKTALRAHCRRAGIDVAHLDAPAGAGADVVVPDWDRLRDAGALLVASVYVMGGWKVSWPLEPAPYDLVVTTKTTSQRVQVKTTTFADGDTWLCRIGRSEYASGGGKRAIAYEPDDVDVFAVVDGDLDVYLLPAPVVVGNRSISVRRYAQYRVPTPWRPTPQAGARAAALSPPGSRVAVR